MKTAHPPTSTIGSESCNSINGGMDWQDQVVLSGIGFVAVVFLAMVLEGIIR
jgi:hypothetical protein